MDRLWLWIAFNAFILVMLAVDLKVVHRKTHAVSIREAGLWTGIWVALALAFGVGVHHVAGSRVAFQYFTGYLIEKALSVDNIFVFVLIFSYFRVPARYQHRVLFWGVLGALVMRGLMIGFGAFLLSRFEWVIYIFGGFLVVTGWRMARHEQISVEPEGNPVIRLLRRVFPVTDGYHGERFFVTRRELGEEVEGDVEGGTSGRGWVATPLLVVLVLVESSDLIFALDSIPAIFGVTRDPFIVYTSNVFAILGLRSLYFLLAGVVDRLVYLDTGLALILAFIGVKMLLSDVVHLPARYSLAVVAGILTVTVAASLLSGPEEDGPMPAEGGSGVEGGREGAPGDARGGEGEGSPG